VTLERVPGREPLPELSVAPGTTAVWDGRFRVTVAGGFAGGPVLVRALGEADLRDLRRRGHGQDGAPARAAAAVPSFRHQGRLVAVPSLRYWAPPGAAANLEAAFLGLQEAGAARDWP
jgi:hypothetical protein